MGKGNGSAGRAGGGGGFNATAEVNNAINSGLSQTDIQAREMAKAYSYSEDTKTDESMINAAADKANAKFDELERRAKSSRASAAKIEHDANLAMANYDQDAGGTQRRAQMGSADLIYGKNNTDESRRVVNEALNRVTNAYESNLSGLQARYQVLMSSLQNRKK